AAAANAPSSGSDGAVIVAWSRGAPYGYTRGDVSFGAGYGLFKYWPSLGVSVGRGVGRGGGLVLDGRDVGYAAESWTAAASVGLPVLRLPETFADLSLGYDVSCTRYLSPQPCRRPVVSPACPRPSAPAGGPKQRLHPLRAPSRGAAVAFHPRPRRGATRRVRLPPGDPRDGPPPPPLPGELELGGVLPPA